MKPSRFIALLLAVYAFVAWNDANAEAIAQTPNKNNGSIILFDTKGACLDGQKTVVARGGNGTTMFGCWFYYEELVWVRYSDGDIRTYDINAFTSVRKEPAKAKGTPL